VGILACGESNADLRMLFRLARIESSSGPDRRLKIEPDEAIDCGGDAIVHYRQILAENETENKHRISPDNINATGGEEANKN